MEYKLSYDYSEMMEGIKEDIAEGILKLEDTIQILRGDIREGYAPIIDWYYEHEKTLADITPNEWDDEKDIIMKRKIARRYEEELPKLTTSTVLDVLTEMEKMNKIL